MQFGIKNPPDQIKRNIVYDIVWYIAYDMKPRTYDVLVKTYNILVAYNAQPTKLYVQSTTSYVTCQTHDIE